MGKKVLCVLTSHAQMGDTGKKTGIWLEEFAAPYYALADKGLDVVLASPKGGQAPIDPGSQDASAATDATKRYDSDPETQAKLSKTEPLAKFKAEDFDAIFYPGGHGPLWDLATDKDSLRLIADMVKLGRPVAAVCHAPCVLVNAVDPSGAPLVKGKRVTGFSNEEEEAVGLTNVVPLLLEDALKEKGGLYERGATWQSFCVEDGRLITGQNPASSEAVAHALMKQLGVQ